MSISTSSLPFFALLIPGSGVPFFNSTPFDLAVVDQGLQILGDNLIAFQAANEPDLYAHPPRTHSPPVGNLLGLSILLTLHPRVMVRKITWVTLACLLTKCLPTPGSQERTICLLFQVSLLQCGDQKASGILGSYQRMRAACMVSLSSGACGIPYPVND